MAGSRAVISIRAADARDAAAIEAIERASFARQDERFSLRRILFLMRNQRSGVLVAERDRTVVGWAAGFVWLRGQIPWGRVYAVATDGQARGAGVGRRLTERVIEMLAARGAERMFLEVRPDNAAAIALYRKLGFQECRALPDYYGRGVPAVRMVHYVHGA